MNGSDDEKDIIEERKIAQDELNRCSYIFWNQAEFFLTLNTATMGIAALVLAYMNDYLFLMPISGFGLFVSIMWLFHGNRIAYYVTLTEKCIMELESRANAKIKRYQIEYLTKKKNLSFLERFSSTYLLKTLLPLGIIILWFTALVSSIIYYSVYHCLNYT